MAGAEADLHCRFDSDERARKNQPSGTGEALQQVRSTITRREKFFAFAKKRALLPRAAAKAQTLQIQDRGNGKNRNRGGGFWFWTRTNSWRPRSSLLCSKRLRMHWSR